MPVDVQEYNEVLEQAITAESCRHIKQARLDPSYDDDCLPVRLVQLTITDNNDVKWHFVFCEAGVAQELVEASEYQSYLTFPYEIFALLDEASPRRMLQTAERFLRDYVDRGTSG